MMEAARTSETLVNFYQTTRCYNPEDSNLRILERLVFRIGGYGCGSGSYPMASLGIVSVETSGFAATVLVIPVFT
jgi:hypothetical protein